MERIDRILRHPLFLQYVGENAKEEETRLFCCHDMAHFLDVARIAWILNLEEEDGIGRDLIYAAALLHDIGRYLQYRDKIPHEQAGVMLAPPILRDCGFDETEANRILSAIATHRDASVSGRKDLNGLLYRADKLSRPCYVCKQEKACGWKQGKKNRNLRY